LTHVFVFLASGFIMEEEPPRIRAARDDGLRIIWVPLFGSFYGPGAPPQIKPITDPRKRESTP
jgi:hypothetical protein